MVEVYAGAEHIITSLGFGIEENIRNIRDGIIGLQEQRDKSYSHLPVPLSVVNKKRLEDEFEDYRSPVKSPSKRKNHTTLEKMLILSIKGSAARSGIDARDSSTLIIISTTKGNIDLLKPQFKDHFSSKRIYLWELGNVIAKHFNNPNKPIVVSNACVSGVIAITTGARLIRSGIYENVIVAGGDLLTDFVVSGFQSFQSLSRKPCKPFDADRGGLSLGEGCGSLVLSSRKLIYDENQSIKVLEGASSNDANHISGPSRTGDGLHLAIKHTLQSNNLLPADIDYISAHGTATDYNDEMEAKAISRSGLENIPVNSYKGYLGHTLGAAGIIESAITMQSMRKNILFRSAGFEKPGVSKDLNIIDRELSVRNNVSLKIASGFGGCNAAVLFSKEIF